MIDDAATIFAATLMPAEVTARRHHRYFTTPRCYASRANAVLLCVRGDAARLPPDTCVTQHAAIALSVAACRAVAAAVIRERRRDVVYRRADDIRACACRARYAERGVCYAEIIEW